jgi:uncharacterized membrane protein YgdD (TMEM256/DUF423 family)
MKLLLANPRKRAPKRRKAVKRRRSTAVATVARVTRRPRRAIARGVKRFRRKLNSRGSRNMTKQGIATLKMGAIAGLGAVGADVLAAKINQFLPVNMRTGVMQQVSQALISVVAGMLINKVNKQAGEAIAMGGVTVASYNLAKSMLAGKGIPGIGDDMNAYEMNAYEMSGNEGLMAYEMSGNEGLMAYNDGFNDAELSDDGMNAYENAAPILY